MLATNPTFDFWHAIDWKTPVYTIEFDGEEVVFTDTKQKRILLLEDGGGFLLEDGSYLLLEGDSETVYKRYLKSISGLSQQVTPEEGRGSIGGTKIELLDYNNEITSLLSTDPYNFHRRKTTIKAGYAGMLESALVPITVGWVTDIKLSSNLLSYIFYITDPQKWFQQKIFKGSEDSPVTISGNALNILLSVLTSTGTGTNGAYDKYAAVNAIGLGTDYINVSAVEAVRDDWFPGTTAWLSFTITERIRAKDWLEKEIFKPLGLYPMIDGQGRFLVKHVKPPIKTTGQEMTIDEDTIIGLPKYDFNFNGVKNEVEWHYNYDQGDDEYKTIDYYTDAVSNENRGPGSKSIVIKSKGLSSYTNLMAQSKNRIFNRFANPPAKIDCTCFFSRWNGEGGDVVNFSHSMLPDLKNGKRGISGARMEVTDRDVDWKRGRVKFKLLDTGFGQGTYQVISPTMTITGVADRENFYVSAADANKYANLTAPEVQVCDARMRQKVPSITILSVNEETGLIQCDDPGLDLQPGWIVLFADYDHATDEQKNFGYIADSNYRLGTGKDDAHLILP